MDPDHNVGMTCLSGLTQVSSNLPGTHVHEQASRCFSTLCCLSLLFLSVAVTFFMECSKDSSNTYPYDTVVLPFVSEVIKFSVSMCLLLIKKDFQQKDFQQTLVKAPTYFFRYSIPALCYIISNNSAPLIIRELGPTSHQILNNLKILATGLLTHTVLRQKLSWLKWRALLLLLLGSALAQLPADFKPEAKVNYVGYMFVFVSTFASGAGSVFSEKLLKEMDFDSIHVKNAKLYAFGVLFSFISLLSRRNFLTDIFEGFNAAAYAAAVTLALSGLVTSAILKYISSIAKCFVMSCSMLVVALVHDGLRKEGISTSLLLGMFLVSTSIVMYHK